MWEKFIFISAASTTSYLNQNRENNSRVGELKMRITMLLRVEFNDIVMQTIHKLETKKATSSMHRDVLAGRKFEFFDFDCC
jgi:2-dehydropantoate 2-reductase